jgi:hypothetical protein
MTLEKRSLPVVILLTFLFVASGYSAYGQRRCCLNNRSSTERACRFDSSSFVGTPLEQAKCLLRAVKIRGHLDTPVASLPNPLENLIGKNVTLNRENLANYLSAQHIDASEIGGQLSEPLSPSDSAKPRGETAKYFVIHDTSTPNYLSAFPANINDPTWSWNNLSRVDKTITHIYVNRVGRSLTVVNFKNILPPTKFGTKFSCCSGERKKGLFIHVELMQPRHCDATNGRCLPYKTGSDIASENSNDNIAPTPGFTKPQMDRLALIYVAASVRKGEWLIPAFHGPIDATLLNAHDDPQNFDLEDWADSLRNLLTQLQVVP